MTYICHRSASLKRYCSTFVEYIAHSLLLLLLEIVCTTCVQLDKRKIAAQLLMLEFIGRKWKKETSFSLTCALWMRALHQWCSSYKKRPVFLANVQQLSRKQVISVKQQKIPFLLFKRPPRTLECFRSLATEFFKESLLKVVFRSKIGVSCFDWSAVVCLITLRWEIKITK